jgi:hypothetical protein
MRGVESAARAAPAKGGLVPHVPEHLELARRHLAEGGARVARQRELLYELYEHGHPTDLAADLLDAMIATMEQMEAHYDYLRREERDG